MQGEQYSWMIDVRYKLELREGSWIVVGESFDACTHMMCNSRCFTENAITIKLLRYEPIFLPRTWNAAVLYNLMRIVRMFTS